jgi:hypothetical protein
MINLINLLHLYYVTRIQTNLILVEHTWQVSFWEEAWFVMLFSAGVARKWKQHNL